MREENIKAVEAYIYGIGNKDLSFETLDENIYFEDPLTVKSHGKENLRAFLTGFLPAIDSVKIHDHICENDTVVTHWEIDGVFGVIEILEKFIVKAGKITEAIAFFDPRPVLGS